MTFSFLNGEKKEEKFGEYEVRIGHESYSHSENRVGPEYGYRPYPPAGAPQPAPYAYGPPAPQPTPYGQPAGYYQPPPNPNQQYYPPPAFPPPELPLGWVSRYDENYRRAYYVNTATGVSQWIFPSERREIYEERRGEGYGEGIGGYAEKERYEYEREREREREREKKEHEKSKKNTMLAAGAGLAVGGLAGAVIAHEMTEHSDEERETIIVEEEPEYVEEDTFDF